MWSAPDDTFLLCVRVCNAWDLVYWVLRWWAGRFGVLECSWALSVWGWAGKSTGFEAFHVRLGVRVLIYFADSVSFWVGDTRKAVSFETRCENAAKHLNSWECSCFLRSCKVRSVTVDRRRLLRFCENKPLLSQRDNFRAQPASSCKSIHETSSLQPLRLIRCRNCVAVHRFRRCRPKQTRVWNYSETFSFLSRTNLVCARVWYAN